MAQYLREEVRRGAGGCDQARPEPPPRDAAAPGRRQRAAPAGRAAPGVRRRSRSMLRAGRWAAYAAVRQALEAFARRAGLEPAGIVPVSALRGDNVTAPLDARLLRRRRWRSWNRCPCCNRTGTPLPGGCRCNGWPAVGTAPVTSRASAGAVWPPARCAPAMRWRSFPPARRRAWRGCYRRSLARATPANRSAWCWAAAVGVSRAATGWRPPVHWRGAAASPPPWPGWIPEPALVGRRYWLRRPPLGARAPRRHRTPAGHRYAGTGRGPAPGRQRPGAGGGGNRRAAAVDGVQRIDRERCPDRRRSGHAPHQRRPAGGLTWGRLPSSAPAPARPIRHRARRAPAGRGRGGAGGRPDRPALRALARRCCLDPAVGKRGFGRARNRR